MAHLTTKQIKQLIEIDGAGSGIRAEIQAVITRLTSGGVGVKTDDPRVAQAKRLYDNCFAGESSFAEYLATIPPVPDFPEGYAERFPELVLVDARLTITKICGLLGIEFPGHDGTYVDFDPKTAKTDKVYWVRMQDGRKNNGKSIRACRDSFAEDEVGLSAYEGLAFFVQNPEGLKGRGMDLGGSVHRDDHVHVAYFHWFYERPKLRWYLGGHEYPDYGSASRGK
jgi:hypothetical protein